MITYLYHKRHKLTGLNYFGKTIQDPYIYVGSGVYWNKHLTKHGNNIETVEVWEFTNLDECSKFAVEFSIKNNIVESKEWANLRIENGQDGGFTPNAYTKEANIKKGNKLRGQKRNKETLEKMSLAKQISSRGSRNGMFGKTHSLESKKLQRTRALNRSKLVCVHCNNESHPGNFTRWHGDNCQKKLN